VVDSVSIRYVGNYLAFKMNTDPSADPTWAKCLADHGIQLGAAKGDVVPMACGGVFAEGVLGRANCSEKLDMTRFWKWDVSQSDSQLQWRALVRTSCQNLASQKKWSSMNCLVRIGLLSDNHEIGSDFQDIDCADMSRCIGSMVCRLVREDATTILRVGSIAW
jgi:hypothetical protein